MRRSQHSSGDLIADRRGAYAEVLASERAFAEAAEVMAQTLELVPGWAAGWNNLGRFREEAGDLAGALQAWRRSVELDPTGLYGASLKLVAHGALLEVGPTAYVETLFDDYAGRFETSLVDRLGYRVPEVLAGLIEAAAPLHGGLGLDLGCGTGLMGMRVRALVDRLKGVDVSAEMLAEAGRKRVYDRLVKADLFDFLAATEPGEAALVTASDVLNYTGPLPPVLAAVYPVLRAGGLFAFSLETHAGPAATLLRTSLRYAHNAEAALIACLAAGFEVMAAQVETLRFDRGEPVAGMLVVLRRPS